MTILLEFYLNTTNTNDISISVITHQFNLVVIHESFVFADEKPDMSSRHSHFDFSFLLLAICIFTTEAEK